jgi:hypothetical protein
VPSFLVLACTLGWTGTSLWHILASNTY